MFSHKPNVEIHLKSLCNSPNRFSFFVDFKIDLNIITSYLSLTPSLTYWNFVIERGNKGVYTLQRGKEFDKNTGNTRYQIKNINQHLKWTNLNSVQRNQCLENKYKHDNIHPRNLCMNRHDHISFVIKDLNKTLTGSRMTIQKLLRVFTIN